MKLSPFARVEAALESESPSRRGPKPASRPANVGFYWWRPHDADPWQVLEVRAEGNALYVVQDDAGRYQCDDNPEHPWTGQWWPINLEPPPRK